MYHFIIGIFTLVVFAGFASSAFAEGNGMANSTVESFVDSITSSVEVSPNAGWFEFSFSEPNTMVKGCPHVDEPFFNCLPSKGTPTNFATDPPWAFDCPLKGCRLTVTDAFLFGDSFQIFDHITGVPVLIGTTPTVQESDEEGCGDDPKVCIQDSRVSSGIFSLEAGPHLISMTVDPMVSEGAAYFKIESHDGPIAGNLLSINHLTLVIAGFSSVLWMMPTVALVGAGIYFVKTRTSRD
jgi:hypothetical protein